MPTETVLWAGFGAVPVVIGLVQAFKNAGFPRRFSGLLAYVLGIAGGLIFATTNPDAGWSVGLGQGLWVGLAASGLYSGIKHAANGHDAQPPTRTE